MFEGMARLRSRPEQSRFIATLVVMKLMFLPAWIMYRKGWLARV